MSDSAIAPYSSLINQTNTAARIHCHTAVDFKECSYLWTITHFECVHLERGIHLTSPSFSASDDDISWCINLKVPFENFKYGRPELKQYIVCRFYPNFSLKDSAIQSKLISSFGTVQISLIGINKEKVASVRKKFLIDGRNVRCGISFRIIGREELLIKKAQLFPNDKLTIFCEFSYAKNTDITSVSATFDPIPLRNLESKLSTDLEQLLVNKDFHDVTIFVKSKSYLAHKNILSARSSIFKAMLRHDMQESNSNRIVISDIDEQVFEEVLRYIYTGKLENLREFAFDLFTAADKYDLTELKIACERELCAKLSDDNSIRILLLADMHHAGHLKARAIDYIKSQIQGGSSEIMSSESWNLLCKSHVHLLKDIFAGFAKKK